MDTPFTDRLLAATNAHDVDAIVACFADGYVNETPCHPARGFTGRQQVRTNWTSMLAAVPDLRAEVVAMATSPGVEWSQWEMRGNGRDGSHLPPGGRDRLRGRRRPRHRLPVLPRTGRCRGLT